MNSNNGNKFIGAPIATLPVCRALSSNIIGESMVTPLNENASMPLDNLSQGKNGAKNETETELTVNNGTTSVKPDPFIPQRMKLLHNHVAGIN